MRKVDLKTGKTEIIFSVFLLLFGSSDISRDAAIMQCI